MKKSTQRGTAWILHIGILVGLELFGPTPSFPSGDPHPSVILISIDTLRADHLSCYGYKRLETPHVDAIARDGTSFPSVNAQVPITLPSHVSMLTSTFPFSNGVEDNGQPLGPDSVTLAAVLRGHGYQTAAFVGAYVLDRRFGLNRGFDSYDSPFNLHGQEGRELGEIKRFGGDVIDAAQQWLSQHGTAPFFVFVHLYDLHTPYELPPGFHPRDAKLAYDDEVTYVDTELGHFWEFLIQRRILANSLVVLTSDHGEGLGDHGESTHGYFVYQSTVSVPLIFHWPSSAQSFPVRVNEPVSLLDLAPTILQFLGVPIPPEFQGRSLLATLNGKSSGRKEFIHSESLFGHRHFDVSALESIREGQFKYIAAPRPELYDLAHDPGELHNIYDQQKSVALVLRGDMLSFRARYRHASAAPGEALDSDTVERLRSLGYMSLSNYRSAPSESGPDPKDRIVQYEQFGRASTLGSQGHLLQAIALLEGLLAKEPSVLDAHLTLGLDLQKLGKHAEAMKSFQEIIKRDPLNSVAHFNLAVSYFALHQQKEAAKECELALAISPAYTRAEELLATICLKEKEYEQARSHFMHILQVVPDDYDALYNLGVMATLERDWAEAEHRLRSALQADPASSQAHNVLGSVCFRKGDLTCAAEEFNDAIHLEPKFAWAHYNLGLVYRQEKKQGDAEREFREALAADPTLGPARSALMSMGVKAP